VLDGARTLGINEPHAHAWRVAQNDLLDTIVKPSLQRRVENDDALRAPGKFRD
jgi:hypothetical protein